MLDEATAAAEAMTLIRRTRRSRSRAAFVVDADTLPQTIAVIATRAEPIGIEVVVADLSTGVEALPVGDFFGAAAAATRARPARSATTRS